MTGRKAPSRLEKAFCLGASALVLLTAAFPRKTAAQEIRIERVGVSAPVGGAAAAAPSGALRLGSGFLSGGAPSALAPSLGLGAAPSALAPGAVPALTGPATRSTPAAAEGLSRPAAPAAAALAPSSSAPEKESARRTVMGPAGEVRAAAAAIAAPIAAPRAAPALDSSSLGAAAADGPRSAESDREEARRDFSSLLGERLAEGKGDASVPAAKAPADNPSVSPRLAAATPARAGSRLLSGVPAALALGAPGVLALAHPSLASWHALSQAGYVAGNLGAAIFPLVQIYQTFHGKSTPRSRAIIGAAASLALGLISAPLLHKSLWGVQNIFGGLTLLVPLFLGAIKGRVRGSGLKETAIISAAALAVSVAAYFAAAAALPGLLAAVFSAAVIGKITLVVQLATSAMFLWMFLPDVVKVLRGKAAGGFSPGFNLMFFLSAVGSMIWALPSAWVFADAHQGTYRMIFAVNAIYALASFLSFWYARRESKPA
jgi:hypothetical protein